MSQRALIGGLTAVMLLTTGTTVALGLRQQRIAAMNAELTLRCDTLKKDGEGKAQTLSELSAQREADQAELRKLRDGSAATIAALRDQVSVLAKQAADVQDEIRRA